MLSAAEHAFSGDSLRMTLTEIGACLQDAWPEGCSALNALQRLDERLRMHRLQVAVLGQFKRGKSTFINALLGAVLLPSAVVPATAIPTFIAWGPVLLIRATYLDGRPDEESHPATPFEAQEALRQWVTEGGNPENRRRIARVDVQLPADILRDGMVVIDTPGIGSTFRHNTDSALQALPECDAAVFVLSADPPITEAELAYLAEVRKHAVRVFFVLSKIDYLSQSEQAEVVAFLQSVLRPGRDDAIPQPIFTLSARQALAAMARGDREGLDASGLTRIEQELLQTLAGEKAAALAASARSKVLAILEQALSDLALQARALELPIEDLAQRAGLLRTSLRAIEAERQAAHDLLEGDRRRALADLEAQAEQLRQTGSRHFSEVAERAAARGSGVPDFVAAQAALESAIPEFFQSRLAGMAADVRQSVEAVLGRHQERANALIAAVRQTASAIFEVPASPEAAAEPFTLGPAPYWVTQRWNSVLMPSPASLLEHALPARLRQARLRQEMTARIGALVQRNVENLRWATLQGLNDTFRRFSAALDERFAEALSVTDGVIGAALAQRQSREGQAAAELQHLRGIVERLSDLRARLRQPGGT
jgi:GTP-binding protein EngB required for normal cell division